MVRAGSSNEDKTMIRSIPLNRLMPSPQNVRRVSDEQADIQLKADIAARGLLQNLVVPPARKSKGSFTVEAGGRRLHALNALVDDGVFEADYEMSCLVLDGGTEEAREASLAENFQRLAMNPRHPRSASDARSVSGEPVRSEPFHRLGRRSQ